VTGDEAKATRAPQGRPADLVAVAENPVPDGAVSTLVPAGRLEIRVARWMPDGPSKGTVVICPGRGEFIEKYAEVVRDLLARSFAVVVFDWRGQGGSSRLTGNRRKGHIHRFDDYLEDLAAVRAHVLEPHCPRPWFGLAHSMGGAIVIDHAARGSCIFERVVLSAPMIAVHGLPWPRAVGAMVSTAKLLRLGWLYVPGGGNRSVMAQPFERNVLTSDPRRYAAMVALAQAAPDLLVGAPTHGWLHAAFQLMARFADPDYPRRILTPILVVACGGDRVVDIRQTERFATRLKAGRLIVIPHAEHEVMMEQDRYREQFWAAFDSFIPGTAAQHNAARATAGRNQAG
jgi:lysophospholipase